MKILKNFLRIFIYAILIVSLTLCVYLKYIHKNFSIISINKNKIELILSEKTNNNITIDKVIENWKNGELIISFSDLKINNKVFIKDGNIKLNIIKSIINKKIEIDYITLNNANIEINKDSENLIINGFNLSEINSKSKIENNYFNTSNFNIILINANIEYSTNKKKYIFNNNKIEIKKHKSNINFKLFKSNKLDLKLDLNLNNKTINGEINSNYEYLDSLINIKKYIHQDLDIKGKINLFFEINLLNLNNIDLNIKLKNNELTIPNIKNIHLENINGKIDLKIKNYNEIIINGYFNSKFLKNNINTNLKFEKNELIINTYGYSNVEELNKWLNNKYLKELKGGSIFTSEITISPSKNRLKVKSNLEGIKSFIPYPFSKNKSKKVNFIYDIDLNNDDIFIHYDNHNIKFKNTNKKEIILIGLNQLYPKTFNEGISIEGKIDYFNLNKFYNYLKLKNDNNNINNNKILNIDLINHIDLEINNLYFKDNFIKNVNLKINNDIENNKEKIILLKSNKIEGKILISENGSYIADFKKLQLYVSNNEEENFEIKDIDLNFLKNGKIKIKNLVINKINFYDLNLEIPKNKKDLEITFTSNDDNFFIGGKLIYDKKNKITKITKINDHLIYGTNIYSLNKWTDDKSTLTTKEFYFDFDVEWSGNPFNFSTSKLNGKAVLKMKELNINGLNSDLMNMKIFNIINIDNIFKFLMFDFSNVSNSNLYFDDLIMDYNIKNGIMNAKEMKLRGSDVLINGSGIVNLNNKTLDTNFKIQIPVTNKIPILTLLIGASPQAAAIVFLVDKIFGNNINEAFDVNIRTYGKWEELKVENK